MWWWEKRIQHRYNSIYKYIKILNNERLLYLTPLSLSLSISFPLIYSIVPYVKNIWKCLFRNCMHCWEENYLLTSCIWRFFWCKQQAISNMSALQMIFIQSWFWLLQASCSSALWDQDELQGDVSNSPTTPHSAESVADSPVTCLLHPAGVQQTSN